MLSRFRYYYRILDDIIVISGIGIDGAKGDTLFPIFAAAKFEPNMFDFTPTFSPAFAGLGELLVVGLLFEFGGVQLASKSTNAIDAKYLNFIAYFPKSFYTNLYTVSDR